MNNIKSKFGVLVSEKKNNQGLLEIYSNDDIETMYIETYSGNYRGGSSYSNEKKVILMSGSGQYIYIDSFGKIIKQDLIPGKKFTIKSDVEHMFYFDSDSVLIESFTSITKKVPSKILRNIKPTT